MNDAKIVCDLKKRNNAAYKLLYKVTRHCYHFLAKTFLSGTTREKLMEEMGYRNSHTFDNQKYKCLEQARKSI